MRIGSAVFRALHRRYELGVDSPALTAHAAVPGPYGCACGPGALRPVNAVGAVSGCTAAAQTVDLEPLCTGISPNGVESEATLRKRVVKEHIRGQNDVEVPPDAGRLPARAPGPAEPLDDEAGTGQPR